MNDYEIEEKIIEAFNNIRCTIDIDEVCDISIEEILEDSLIFVSFIVELEQIFSIEIPDEFLLPEKISSFESVKNMILEIARTENENKC
mgnify:CR=1 FL=1